MRKNVNDYEYWQKLRQKSLKEHPLKRTPLKRSGVPIKKVADKRKKQIATYNKEIKTWKEQNPYCEMKLEGCTVFTEDNHHPYGKEGDLLNAPANRKPACRNCHRKATDMGIEEAIKQGLSERRNVSIEERKSRLNKQ